jgi:hypothetical protein
VGPGRVGIEPIRGFIVPIDASGSFENVRFPPLDPVKDSSVLVDSSYDCAEGGVTGTPSTLKIINAQLEVSNSKEESAGYVQELSNIDGDFPIGWKRVDRLYATSDGKMSGTCKEADGTTYTNDITLSKGWNVVWLEVTAKKDGVVTGFKQTSGSLPSDVKFFYGAGTNPLSIGLLK